MTLVRKESKLGRAVMAAYGHACAACGCADVDSLQIDHVTARTNRGGNELENLQVLCGACNLQKSAAAMPRLPPWRGEKWGSPPQAAIIARKRWRVACARAKRTT